MHESTNFKVMLLSENESEAFFELIQNNHKRLEDFFAGTVSKTKTLDSTIQYCKEIDSKIKRKEYFPYLIIEIQTNKPIGFIDVKNINWDIPKAELGAFIDTNYEGMGLITSYCTELINQLLQEHKFKKLFCRVAERNTRSIKVIENLGFTLEGTLRREYKTTKGELVDLRYYGKVFN